jgi:hypothetical protein
MAGGGPSVQELDLPPLNNVLVNVYINPSAYARQKNDANGGLQPVRCSSMKSAAYLFEPAVKVTPPAVDGTSIGELLPDGDVEQSIDYWRNCKNEGDLARHFTPSGIVTSMRPSRQVDRLGTLIRLRLAEVTYRSLSTKADAGELEELLTDQAPSAIRAEKERLAAALNKVRASAIRMMEQAQAVTYTVPDQNREVKLTIKDTPVDELRDHLNSPKAEAVARLIDHRLEYDRLQALIAR